MFYRVCQGFWSSLMFADEDIESQIFWASSKSHVATTYLCMHFCSNCSGWSKVSIMKSKCTLLNRMWQHDFVMKQIFYSSLFLSENTGRLAKQTGYPGHNPGHTWYVNTVCARDCGLHEVRMCTGKHKCTPNNACPSLDLKLEP